MKYWLFEHGDVVGPFSVDELSGRDGFGPHSLVCPEDRGDDDTFWQEAQLYEDFVQAAPTPVAAAAPAGDPVEKKDVFDEELDTLLSEENPLGGDTEPSARENTERVHFPPHEPAKSGPIEDYFNNMQGGDLGNILGIPDPNENSDMNLARALEKQFKQTQPPVQAQTPQRAETGPFDEFTAKEDLDDLTPGDGLAAVAPLNDNGAPVVLAEKPLPAEEKPKFRVRKKPEGADDQTEQTGDSREQVQAGSVRKEPAAQEDSSPSAGQAALNAEAQPPEEAAEPEKTEAQPAVVSAGEPVLRDHSQKQTTPEETRAPAQETLPRAEDARAQSAPQAELAQEPEAETLVSIPLSVSREPLTLSLKNPDGLKEKTENGTSAAQKAADSNTEKDTTAPQPGVPEQTGAAVGEAAHTGAQTAPAAQAAVPSGRAEQSSVQKNTPPSQDPVEEIMSGVVDVNTAPEVPEPIKQVAPVVEPQVNRVKTTLKKTPEIEQFLTKNILPVDEEQPVRRKKSVRWAAALLVLLLLAGGILLLLKPAAPQAAGSTPQAQPLTQEGGAVDELMPDAAVQPEVPSAQEALSLQPSASSAAPAAPELNPADKARQIVQNYKLSNFDGNVADYFDRIYKDKLAQGYSATWSAERLHNHVYIVKYRLSKTRSEPVVYIFQVDVSRNKLTGALNNITLDLIGKIK